MATRSGCWCRASSSRALSARTLQATARAKSSVAFEREVGLHAAAIAASLDWLTSDGEVAQTEPLGDRAFGFVVDHICAVPQLRCLAPRRAPAVTGLLLSGGRC